MFRASPWISYEPAESKVHHGSPPDSIKAKSTTDDMDEDVDMDAPQISILRDEESPPPPQQPTRTSKFRVKLLVNDAKAPPASPGSTSRKPSNGPRDDPSMAAGEEDDDEEEDQLMDDDNHISPSTLPKRRSSSKRKPKRNDRRGPEDEKKPREKAPTQPGRSTPGSLLYCFPTSTTEPASRQNTPPKDVQNIPSGDTLIPPESSSIKTAPVKKMAPIRAPLQRSKGKAVPRSARHLLQLVRYTDRIPLSPRAVPTYDDENLTESKHSPFLQRRLIHSTHAIVQPIAARLPHHLHHSIPMDPQSQRTSGPLASYPRLKTSTSTRFHSLFTPFHPNHSQSSSLLK